MEFEYGTEMFHQKSHKTQLQIVNTWLQISTTHIYF